MHTNAPEGISRNHLLEIAKKCGLIGGYRTVEMLDAIEGYARVVLADVAVQEAFVAANQHLFGSAVLPEPTFRAVNIGIDALDGFYKYGYDREQCYDALCDMRTLTTANAIGQGSAACGASHAPTGCAAGGSE